jgi:hypothetical protein
MEHSRAGRLDIIGPIQNKCRIIGRKGLSFAGFRSISSIVAGKISFTMMNPSEHYENGVASIHQRIVYSWQISNAKGE